MATVWEAAVLAGAGMDDLFVVNTVAHPAKLRTLAELARDHRILVAVDEAANAAAQSAAAVTAGSTLGIMVEVDTGMDRCGVDTAPDCLALARQVTDLPGLRFEGITGYEGPLLADTRQRPAARTPARGDDVLHRGRRPAGVKRHPLPDPLGRRDCHLEVDGGLSRPHRDPGRHVRGHGQLPRPDGARLSSTRSTIQATVISRQSGQVIVDAGNKSVADPADVTIVGHDLEVVRFDEEHGIFAAPGGSPLRVGDTVALVPGYSPSTVNWYDAYHVVRDDVVVDVWPIIPRGPGHHGLAARER